MRTPQENPDGYREGSCLTYVDQLKGKLLLMHGLVDDNVHPSNTWQLVDALQKRDLRFDLMVYPESEHGLGQGSTAIRWEYLHEHLHMPVQIMIDPGLGFGKTAMDNMRLIKHLRELTILGRPIVVGPSRKSFIGHVTGGGPRERIEGTAAAVTAAIMNGSRVVRVHDVKTMKKVAAMADALVNA